ncbi:DUF3747 domain-containing protein [Coleofasciculus sp. FACHB-SPT9]|uniref:DUF3747 domain-containing protein n=1 Tax=Cyanophyceae TaxID=3028117 RepID=UPI0016891FB6|nr:DUF3747 domain-containing protein [Coleofasciculus sp. FACHB-SPT9]MBD1892763.1 DUF3747 domain-containing protein [Coleofasciculus sp. FACHB-SPT9]
MSLPSSSSKRLFGRSIAALATVVLSTLSAVNPSPAAVFTQKEVEQGKFIAVAAPYGTNSHQLLILEQISDKRACWSESGDRPTAVDPLLLNFDFTGICGRSTDSNGYSMRMAGTDLGLKYSFNLVKRDGELVLVGTNFSDRTVPTIEIGRTNGLSDGFMKINLDPAWRFAKRTYNGKTLGHVYLASDQAAPGIDPGDIATPPGSSTFGDIASDVYAKEIEQAVALGFVAGFKEDNTFRPQVALTREQLVSMVLESLTKLPGANVTIPTQAASRPYPDVDASRWSAAKIKWARDNNIVSGYQDGTFKPTQPVTRAELMAVLQRAAEFGKNMRGLSPELATKNLAKTFSDTEKHWAASLISQMSSYCNVASPVNEVGSKFEPNSPTRRNYAAAATLRMLNCVKTE